MIGRSAWPARATVLGGSAVSLGLASPLPGSVPLSMGGHRGGGGLTVVNEWAFDVVCVA